MPYQTKYPRIIDRAEISIQNYHYPKNGISFIIDIITNFNGLNRIAREPFTHNGLNNLVHLPPAHSCLHMVCPLEVRAFHGSDLSIP